MHFDKCFRLYVISPNDHIHLDTFSAADWNHTRFHRFVREEWFLWIAHTSIVSTTDPEVKRTSKIKMAPLWKSVKREFAKTMRFFFFFLFICNGWRASKCKKKAHQNNETNIQRMSTNDDVLLDNQTNNRLWPPNGTGANSFREKLYGLCLCSFSPICWFAATFENVTRSLTQPKRSWAINFKAQKKKNSRTSDTRIMATTIITYISLEMN